MEFSVFDSLLEPVFVIDLNKSVKYCNSAAAKICGLSIRRISKLKSVTEAVTFINPIVALLDLKLISDPSPYEEISFVSAAGDEGVAQITIQKVNQDNEFFWVMFFRDVTLEETLQKKYRAEWLQKEEYFKKLKVAHEELEIYSRQLEQKVLERTQELQYLNRLTQALLDSLNQSFFLFDVDGKCLPIASQACLKILEVYPPGLNVLDVLKIKNEEHENFKRWMQTIFAEMLPFEDLVPLGPEQFLHSAGRHIQLQYFPVRADNHELQAIVVVGTDTTDIDEALHEAEKEKAFARLVINIIKKKKGITQFITDSRSLIAELKVAIETQKEINSDHVFRLLHTIKGNSATYSVLNLTQACHNAESIISELRNEGNSKNLRKRLVEHTTKIESCFLDFLISNEEIIGKAAVNGIRTIEVPIDEVQTIFGRLKKISQAAQLATELEDQLLSVPIKSFFDIYDEVIQQVASASGKKVRELSIEGGEILARTEVYADLFTTFVHQFNNAVDHGIETPEERIVKGKSQEGEIKVKITLEESAGKSNIKICINDDGKGIDPEVIRRKLAERGIDASERNNFEVIQQVFASQFSTRNEVSEISGRGVGLDAVLYAARKLGGNAWVESQVGKGTSLFVIVPYHSLGDSLNKVA